MEMKIGDKVKYHGETFTIKNEYEVGGLFDLVNKNGFVQLVSTHQLELVKSKKVVKKKTKKAKK
jgi:hypothetical protein